MSDWYEVTGVPASNSLASSAAMRSEFAAISTAMAKLPTLTGRADEVLKTDSSGAAIESVPQLAVAQGGTGVGTLTDGGLLLGSGTGDVTAMAALADGEIVIGDGTTDPVAYAAFSSSTGTLNVSAGGTGADSASAARTNLGVAIGSDVQAHSAVLDATTASFLTADETKLDGIETAADVTDVTNVTAAGAHMAGGTDIPVTDGGTGSSTASGARTNLGLVIGTDVQAYDAVLAATTASFLTADETKLDGIEAEAEVTSTAKVDAAGAVMNTDSTTASMAFVVDEDDMASDLATKVPTQQSVRTYVLGKVASSVEYQGGYNADTNTPDLDTSPSGVTKGDMYVVTVAGTFFTVGVEVGDTLLSEVDGPTVESDWTVINKNLDDASIKAAYENNADTNAFTDDEQTKVGYITITGAVDLDDIAAGNFGALTATGAFTSLGIDDNATAERLQITDTEANFGTASTGYTIGHATNTKSLQLVGGSAADEGAGIKLFSTNHATKGSDTEFSVNGTVWASYDYSASSLTLTNLVLSGASGSELATFTRNVVAGRSFKTTVGGYDALSSGEGRFYSDTTNGVNLHGYGSTNDVRLLNQVGNTALQVPTNTQNVEVVNHLQVGGTLNFAGINPTILSNDPDGILRFAAGASSADGANINLYASAHATKAYDVTIRAASTVVLDYDYSGSNWDFQDNAITTTGDITGDDIYAGTYIVQGHTDPITFAGTVTSRVQSHDTSSRAGFGAARWYAGSGGPTFSFGKSRGASVGTNAATASGDHLGTIIWGGDDGSGFEQAASIRGEVDGTPGAGDMPGRIVFNTSADGSASPTERMRIDSSGNVGIGGAATGAAQLFVNQTSTSTNGMQINMGLGAENTASGLRIKGYSPALEFMDKDSTANWFVGIDDNDGNAFLIGKGYGPGQSLTPAIKIDGGISAATNAITIASSGNVDIGNDLYTSGDIEATGDITGSNLNVSNWDTAYGWGDHASQGYLDSASTLSDLGSVVSQAEAEAGTATTERTWTAQRVSQSVVANSPTSTATLHAVALYF